VLKYVGGRYSVLTVRRYTLSLSLTPRSQELLDELHRRLGTSKRQLGERLLEWFVAQDEEVQLMILGVYSEQKRGETAERLLREWAASSSGDGGDEARQRRSRRAS